MNARGDGLECYLREVEIMSRLRHPRVVPFLAASLPPGQCFIVMELLPGGTLKQWRARALATSLHPNIWPPHLAAGAATDPTRGPPQAGRRPRCRRRLYGPDGSTQQALRARTTAALEVAQGMLYLHSCSPPVLHRDLKPSNVFMDSAGSCRIGDFGMSCLLPAVAAEDGNSAGSEEAGLTGETGTYVYMAPEASQSARLQAPPRGPRGRPPPPPPPRAPTESPGSCCRRRRLRCAAHR